MAKHLQYRLIEEIIRYLRPSLTQQWTQRIAVGSQSFIEKIKEALGFKASGRKIRRAGDSFELRESLKPYGSTNAMDPGNTFLGDQ